MNSATAILGIHDVNYTIPYTSVASFSYNTLSYIENTKEKKRKEQALMKIDWGSNRYIYRDFRNIYVSTTVGKHNVTDEWHETEKILHTLSIIWILCLLAHYVFETIFHIITKDWINKFLQKKIESFTVLGGNCYYKM